MYVSVVSHTPTVRHFLFRTEEKKTTFSGTLKKAGKIFLWLCLNEQHPWPYFGYASMIDLHCLKWRPRVPLQITRCWFNQCSVSVQTSDVCATSGSADGPCVKLQRRHEASDASSGSPVLETGSTQQPPRRALRIWMTCFFMHLTEHRHW